MSSFRVYPQIDDQEEEEEEEEEEKRVFFGNNMFELYSVVIKEIKGGHIHGNIKFERTVPGAPPYIVIYDGDEGKIGEPLLLRGTSQPFLAYDPFYIQFDLCPEELEPLSYAWVPFCRPHNGVVTEEIVEEGWGKVTLTFQMFSFAVDAHVRVMFLGIDDDGKMKYPSHVYGEIYATCDGRIDTKVVLFRRNSEEAEPVDNGEPIPLSRSVIAAQILTRLHIHVDLWGCYDSSDAIQTSFDESFKVRTCPSRDTVELDPSYHESPVLVDVTWVEHRFPDP